MLAAACGGRDETGDARTFADLFHVDPERCGFDGARELPLAPDAPPRERVRRIARAVEELRGLEQRRRVEPTLVSRSAFERRVRSAVLAELDPDDLARIRRAGDLLAAVPRRLDLREAILDTVTAIAAGFYDPERREIVVARSGAEELQDIDVATIAHELEHALVDSALGIPEGDPRDDWGDTALAAAALREGSATLVEFRFLESLLGDELFRRTIELELGPAELAPVTLPHALGRSFVFPYVEGIGFVCELYASGGWAAVDRAYRRPPATSAEILFPERYLARERAAAPPELGRLPRPWRRDAGADGVFGAADLLWLFEAPGDRPSRALDDPLRRAGGWNGGRVQLWTRGGESALAIGLAQRPDAASLCVSLRLWYARARPDARRRSGGGLTTFEEERRVAALACGGRGVRFAVAPTRTEALLLVREER